MLSLLIMYNVCYSLILILLVSFVSVKNRSTYDIVNTIICIHAAGLNRQLSQLLMSLLLNFN